jgi:hypothetical protein
MSILFYISTKGVVIYIVSLFSILFYETNEGSDYVFI